MKKPFLIIAFVLFIFLGLSSTKAFSYTVYIAVDDRLNLDVLDGIDVFTSGISKPINDLTLDVYYQSGGSSTIDGITLDNAVPDDYVIGSTVITNWDIFLTTYGANAASELDENLIPGLVLSLTGDSIFDVTLGLNSDDYGNGKYPFPFSVKETSLTDGTLYTATVPLPSAILLLGSGLVALIGLRRKVKSS